MQDPPLGSMLIKSILSLVTDSQSIILDSVSQSIFICWPHHRLVSMSLSGC